MSLKFSPQLSPETIHRERRDVSPTAPKRQLNSCWSRLSLFPQTENSISDACTPHAQTPRDGKNKKRTPAEKKHVPRIQIITLIWSDSHKDGRRQKISYFALTALEKDHSASIIQSGGPVWGP
jgi:hypothetical protein